MLPMRIMNTPIPSKIPFGPVKGIEWVTSHCLSRFKERVGVTGTAGEVLRHLEKWVEKSSPERLRESANAYSQILTMMK